MLYCNENNIDWDEWHDKKVDDEYDKYVAKQLDFINDSRELKDRIEKLEKELKEVRRILKVSV